MWHFCGEWIFGGSHLEVFCEKRVSKHFAKVTGKHVGIERVRIYPS